jgi:hypothetical protein
MDYLKLSQVASHLPSHMMSIQIVGCSLDCTPWDHILDFDDTAQYFDCGSRCGGWCPTLIRLSSSRCYFYFRLAPSCFGMSNLGKNLIMRRLWSVWLAGCGAWTVWRPDVDCGEWLWMKLTFFFKNIHLIRGGAYIRSQLFVYCLELPTARSYWKVRYSRHAF